MQKPNRLLNISLLILSLFGGVLLLAGTPRVSAQLFNDAKGEACRGINLGGGDACADGSGRLQTILGAVLNILSVIIGFIAVIMIVIAALKFITSQGEASNIASARSTLLYAVVGLIVVALAQFIVRFVLARSTR